MQKSLKYYVRIKNIADMITLFGVIVLSIGFGFILFLEDLMGFLLLIGGIVFIILGPYLFKKNQYQFKEHFLKERLNHLLDDIVYEPIRSFKDQPDASHFFSTRNRKTMPTGLTWSEVNESQFVPLGNSFTSMDFIKGTIDGVKFISSDVETRKITSSSKGNSKSVTLFKGRVFIFEFNKPIDGSVFALEKYKPTNTKMYSPTKMESIDFNKKFDCFADKDHLAYYILTPHMMEILLHLEKNHPGQIGFSFVDSKLFIALKTNRQTFSLPHLKKVDSDFLDAIENDFNVFYKLIEELKLSCDLFKDETSPKKDNLHEVINDPYSSKFDLLIDKMVFKFENGKKTLVHTKESQAIYDILVKGADERTIQAYDMKIKMMSSVRLMHMNKDGELKKQSSSYGCLSIVAFIAFFVISLIVIAFFNGCT